MATEKVDLENRSDVTEVLTDVRTESVHDADVHEKVLSHVGSMGRYQRLLIISMIPFGFTYAFSYFVQMFITVTPQNYWCRIPELANLSVDLRRNLSAPGAATGDWDQCMTFDTNWTQVLDTLALPSPETPKIPCQHGWEFEFSDIPYESVVTERGWVCNHASYVPTAQSVFFVGAVIGTIIFGWLADRFGRVPALVATNLVGGIGGIATTFTTGVWDFLFCRFLVGLGFDNCFTLVYILILEFVGPQHRTLVANTFMASTYGIGGVILPWIALYVSNWRLLLWVTSLPMLLVLLTKWFTPESVRWLVSRGRVSEAVSIIKRFESINRTTIPDDVMDLFITSSTKVNLEKKRSTVDLFRNPLLCKAMLKMLMVYMGGIMVIDGLLRLSDTFGMGFFTVFSCNEVFEFLAVLLVAFVLDRVGRRNLTWVPTFTCGIFIIISLFIPKGFALTTLAIVARFFMIMCNATAMQWSIEILPTPFRASGISILHTSVFVAVMLSSFIAYSERVWSMLPMLIFIVAAFITSMITYTLPETRGQPLPQTVSDVENLISKYSYKCPLWRLIKS